jgi:hypothetical protein
MRPLFAALTTLAFALPSTGNVDLKPKGLNIVDWSQIRAEYEHDRHTVFPDGDGFKQS